MKNITNAISRAAIRTVIASTVVLLAACGSDSPTSPSTPPTPQHSVRLTNNSMRTVKQVFVSPCSSPTWGDNQLPAPLAPAGVKHFPVTEPGCYDVRVVATDGHSWRRDELAVQGVTGVQVQ